MKILFIAFEFPPLNSGGAQRPLKFTKYLPDFSITPIVITTDIPGLRAAFTNPQIDLSLEQHISTTTKVVRIPFPTQNELKPGRFKNWFRIYFSIVEDIASKWNSNFYKVLPSLIELHQPTAIYVTAPPFCMAPLACKIKERFGLPLILDFRDAWSQWTVSPYGSWFHYALTKQREAYCLTKADHIICTSEQTRSDFLSVHKLLSPDKISVIPNGYDADIEKWQLPRRESSDPFTIGYVGSFYYSPKARSAMMSPWWRKRPHRMIQFSPRKEDWLYRSPYFFFKSIAHLFNINPSLRKQVRIKFVGHKPDWIQSQIDEFGLTDSVELLGPMSHSMVLPFQEKCDALLVTSAKVIGGRDYSIAGKTFEYLTQKVPIIGFVCEGEQKDFLARTGCAIICDPDNPEDSAHRIHSAIAGTWKAMPDYSFINSFHRRNNTKKLAEIIHRLTGTTT